MICMVRKKERKKESNNLERGFRTYPKGINASIEPTVITIDCVAMETSPITPAAIAMSSNPHLDRAQELIQA
jgi:hypothetical protein